MTSPVATKPDTVRLYSDTRSILANHYFAQSRRGGVPWRHHTTRFQSLLPPLLSMVQFWTLFGIFIIVTHVIILLAQVSSDDYYEMKFQMLKGSSSCAEILTFKLVHTCSNLCVPRVQVALWHSSWLNNFEFQWVNSSLSTRHHRFINRGFQHYNPRTKGVN